MEEKYQEEHPEEYLVRLTKKEINNLSLLMETCPLKGNKRNLQILINEMDAIKGKFQKAIENK